LAYVEQYEGGRRRHKDFGWNASRKGTSYEDLGVDKKISQKYDVKVWTEYV
jgi:hypothetical protein